MRKFARRVTRQIAADRVVRLGKRLRQLEAMQEALGDDQLDGAIDSLIRERDRLLDYIRTTAPQEA